MSTAKLEVHHVVVEKRDFVNPFHGETVVKPVALYDVTLHYTFATVYSYTNTFLNFSVPGLEPGTFRTTRARTQRSTDYQPIILNLILCYEGTFKTVYKFF